MTDRLPLSTRIAEYRSMNDVGYPFDEVLHGWNMEIQELERLVASRDTRDAGAVAPVAWAIYAENRVIDVTRSERVADHYRQVDPFLGIIPLVPAPPGRAGTDGADQERR